MPRAEDQEEEPTGSYDAVSTRFRAETNEIVGNVTKYCEEMKTDSAMSRRRRTRLEHLSSKTVSSSIHTYGGGTQAREGEEALEGRQNDEELPECKSLAEPKVSSADGLEHGVHTNVEINSGGFTPVISNCESCAARTGVGAPSSESDKEDEHHGDLHCCLTTLELPDVSLATHTTGYTGIKQGGEHRLRQTIEKLSVLEEDTLGSNADEPDLWSCWKPYNDDFEKKNVSDADRDIKAQELLCVSGPRRMQCSWCEKRKSGEEFLYDESNRLLKKMVKVNAQTLLLVNDIVVPNVFEADWGRLLDDVHSLLGGEPQQMLLPVELVRGDDTKITNAPSKLISIANSYLRSLQRSDVSLTKASMNIPRVWNLAVAADALADVAAEELKPEPMHSNSSVSPSSVRPILQLDRLIPENADNSQNPESASHEVSSRAKLHSDGDEIVLQTDQPSPVSAKLKVIAEDKFLSTDYFLSDKFLQCNWSEATKTNNAETISFEKDTSTDDSRGPSKYDQLLQQIARPALWDLMRKKLLQVDRVNLQRAFDRMSLETLEAIIYQQFRSVKKMSLNPSAFSSVEISEACTSLRQAAWLHTLRIVSIGQMTGARNGKLMSDMLARILPSAKYKLVLGPSNWKDLYGLLEALVGNVVHLEQMTESVGTSTRTLEEDSTLQPPHKKQRVLQIEKQNIPVRVLCSVGFLEQDELLDELCTEQQIFAIERKLPPPIDILVDERNCVCIVTASTFQAMHAQVAEANMRNFIFSLARLQVQLKKCWLVIALGTSPSIEMEDMMNVFFAALVQFRIETQVFTSFSCEETGRFMRGIVDECAEVALNDHRILPRLWFERPFLLEEESQFERFLVSTRIVNHFTAQSLLHKICMEDLFSKSLNELKLLVQSAATDEQLELLWRFVQQNHELNGPMQYM